MQRRNFTRINITISPSMLAQLAECQAAYNISRSNLIQFAVRDWLAQQPIVPGSQNVSTPKVSAKQQIVMLCGEPFDPEASFYQYLQAFPESVRGDHFLEEYEAARDAYFGRQHI